MVPTDPTNVEHVLHMVLMDNKGQMLTEALILGIQQSVSYYLRDMAAAEASMKGRQNATELE